MKNRIAVYQVDAFTHEPFKGNPAGVCILDREMPEVWMQNIAAEIRVSETAFITGDSDRYKIRFFTPESEVPLCGHATLASAHILYENGATGKEEQIVFSSGSGILTVRYSGSWLIMNFPSYELDPLPRPYEINRYIGSDPEELYITGHGWVLALMKSEEDILRLSPDFKSMKSSRYGNLIVTAPSDDPVYDFCVRCFCPPLGIDEDPVTGSAQSILTPYWHKKLGKTEFISRQVSKRGGILKTAVKGDRVEIGGQAKTIFKAELLI